MIDFVNQIVNKSVELNNFPKETINDLTEEHNLDDTTSQITFLIEEGKKGIKDTYASEPREWEDSVFYIVLDENFPLAFGIQYDWIDKKISMD
jgi:hypothetical protein